MAKEQSAGILKELEAEREKAAEKVPFNEKRVKKIKENMSFLKQVCNSVGQLDNVKRYVPY